MKEEQLQRALFNEPPEQYAANEKHHAHLLEQYKLYVEMMDRASGRRLTANSYFLSVNTALLGVVAYVAKDTHDYLWILGFAGVVLCYLWFSIIRSYSDLNTIKFSVIHAIEKRLPLNLYSAEWMAAGGGKDTQRYHPLTHLERGVPFVFMALHIFVILRTLPWAAVCGLWR